MALEKVIWDNQHKYYVAVERKERPAVAVEALGVPISVMHMIGKRDESIPSGSMPEGADAYFWGVSINESSFQDSASLQYGRIIKVLDGSQNILENPGMR